MKKIKILVSIISFVSLASCDSFLSEMPDDRTQLDSEPKIKELLVFAYPDRVPYTFLEAMSDNVTDNGNSTLYTRENEAYYQWEDDIDQTLQDSPAGYWDACYTAISQANQALDAISKLEETNELLGVKAEALLARAYAHFQLVLIWAKAYDPATASTDLGVPYVNEIELELIKHYERNSVQEVYDLIEQDLLEGLKNIDKASYSAEVKKFHFDKNSARAFAARFYLYKGDWDKVLEYTNHLGSKPNVGNVLRDYVALVALGNEGLLNYASSEPASNLLISTQPSWYRRTFIYDRYSCATKFMQDEMFGNNNPYGKRYLYRLYSFSDDNRWVGKLHEYFKILNPTAGTGVGHLQTVLFGNDELYLNRMEALAMTNRIDEAIDELGYFIGNRVEGYNPNTDILTLDKLKSMYPDASELYTPFYSLTGDQATVVQAIAEARRREFIHEGHRWFDIKRFNLVVKHAMEGGNIVLEKNDPRRAFQLPIHVRNSGMAANPR